MLGRIDEFESALFATVIIVITVAWVWWRLRQPIDLDTSPPREIQTGLSHDAWQVVRESVREVAWMLRIAERSGWSNAGRTNLAQEIRDLCVLCDVDPGKVNDDG